MTYALIALAGLIAPLAQSGDDPDQTPSVSPSASAGYAVVDGRQIYEPIYFADITPRTAADMLFQVPGFVVRSTGGGRGLGQGGTNVLINGARITGKGTGPVDILRRTPAATVIRIEIVDAASLGIPGLTGQVADVYISPQGLTGNWAYRPTFREGLEPDLGNFAVSLSGEKGPVTYTVGLENDSARRGNRGPEIVTGPDGAVIEERFEDGKFFRDRPEITAALVWNRKNGDLANLAVSHQWGIFSNDERRDTLFADGSFAGIDSQRKENERNGELSGDYARDMFGGRLKLIGLASFEHSPVERTFTSQGSDGSFSGGFFDQTIDEAERIGRAEMVWQALGGTVELAGELAFNSLEAEEVSGEVTPDDSREPSLPSPPMTRVEELRRQVSVALSRPLGPLDVQASIGFDIATISQPGSTQEARTLRRPNGFLSAAYEWGEDTDFLLRLERRVGQLNFFDFVTSVDLVDGTEQCANPGIVPQQSWFLEGQTVQRFGARTQVTLSAFGELIEDRVDTIPLPCGADGAGNIETATVYGGSAQGTVDMGSLWSGVEADFSVDIQESRLNDPFTFQDRAFNGDQEWRWSFDVRRDVPNSPWAYGFGANQARFAARSRRLEASRDRQQVFAFLFAEHRDVFGAELNVTLSNVLGQDETRERFVFDDGDGVGGRGPLVLTEDRNRTFGPILQVRLSNTF